MQMLWSIGAGGIYQIRLQFPDQYPEKPPRVKFVTEMFHPNSEWSLLAALCP